MASDLISRKALYKKITEGEFTTGNIFKDMELQDFINEQPTVDAVEVVRGRWWFDPDGMDWGIGAWKCSHCGCKNDNLGSRGNVNPYHFAGSKFCPHCGAKMDGCVKQ